MDEWSIQFFFIPPISIWGIFPYQLSTNPPILSPLNKNNFYVFFSVLFGKGSHVTLLFIYQRYQNGLIEQSTAKHSIQMMFSNSEHARVTGKDQTNTSSMMQRTSLSAVRWFQVTQLIKQFFNSPWPSLQGNLFLSRRSHIYLNLNRNPG